VLKKLNPFHGILTPFLKRKEHVENYPTHGYQRKALNLMVVGLSPMLGVVFSFFNPKELAQVVRALVFVVVHEV
jgi:hypothetical protein